MAAALLEAESNKVATLKSVANQADIALAET